MNNSIKGLFIGLVSPIAVYIVFIAFYMEDPDPIGIFYKLIEMNKITHAISLSVLINLVIFFMKIKTNRDDHAKGILFATFIYAFVILILKII